MPASAKAKGIQTKLSWEEYRIELVGDRREDGTMFVTSPSLPTFSAVLITGKWDDIKIYLKMFLEQNVGPVKEMRLIRDASELVINDSESAAAIPPAYVVAELIPERVGAR